MTLIKEIDLNQLAFSGLYKRLIKDGVLRANAQIVEAIEEELPAPKRERRHLPSKEEVDVNSLIMRTQLLVNELKASVTRLQTAISMEGSHSSGSQPLSTVYKPRKPVQEEVEWGGVQAVGSARGLSQASISGEESEAASDSLAFDARYSDADDDGWESGSVDSAGQVIPYSRRAIANSEDSDSDMSNVIRMDFSDMSGEDSDDGEMLGGSSRDRSPPAKNKKMEAVQGSKSKGKMASGGNVFLPSLSVGFLPGDHDPTDDWKSFDVDGPPLKKNRMGQRARRALAEKKYGKRAKHLRNQSKDLGDARTTPMTEKEKQKAERLAKRQAKKRREWEERKRALKSMLKTHTVRDDDFFVGGKSNQQDPTILQQSKGNRLPRTDDKRSKNGKAQGKADDKPIHPSWQAKQRLKQKESLGATRPQGKKIVFG
ncbi:hypothetical protein M407DRAFT_18625 [Tulasnella calospora MUT 4182]|uniref:Bud22 domain-containing protein n=1 Tax=Tulasnella calospora MUT 4182 TaxID=1051891 RepID=A0A0C3QJQ5_9AGAM|nr:hypothetical protein M407DRAFT_18625 [Tulasnella calospora MUT 4182]